VTSDSVHAVTLLGEALKNGWATAAVLLIIAGFFAKLWIGEIRARLAAADKRADENHKNADVIRELTEVIRELDENIQRGPAPAHERRRRP
jgi:hypothetical protein